MRPFGEQSVFQSAIERFRIPLFGHFVDIDRLGNHLFDKIGDILDDLFVHVFPFEDLHALRVHHFALFVHDVVVLQDVFTDTEVAALDGFLRVFDAAGKHSGLQAGIFILAENAVDLFQALAAEPLDEVVLQRDEEDGHAGVALTAGTAAQLVVDTAGFVTLGTEDAQAARFDDFLFFRIRFRLVLVVQFVVHGAVFEALLLRFALQFRIRSGEFDLVVFHALFAHTLFGEIFGVAAQQDIRSAARHVGGDGHGAQTARLRDDLRFALVVLRVEDVVLDAVFAQHLGDLLTLFDGSGTDQQRLPLFVALGNFAQQGALFAVHGRIHGVRHILADDGLVGGDLQNVQRVNGTEFPFLRLCGTRHARELFIQTEEVLEGDGGVRLVFVADLDPFLCLDRLVQTVRIAAADHQTARKLVHDDDFVVVDDVILVAVEELVRFERLLDMVVEGGIFDVAQVIYLKEVFRFGRALFRDLDAALLAVDDVIPIAVLGALGDVVIVAVLGFFFLLRLLLLFFAFLFGFLVLFALAALVVKAAREGAHEPVHALVQFAGLVAFTGNDERRSRLIDEDGVHFVDDGKGKFALDHAADVRLQIVAQIIEAEFVVGGVGDVAVIRFALGVVVHAGNDHAHGEAEEAMHFAHPFRVAAGKVIVDGDDVNALSCKCVEVCGQSGDQRLAFARLHLCDTALVQGNAADDLHVIVFEFEHAPRRFPHDRKGVVENVVQRFARAQPVLEDLRLRTQLRVRHDAVFGFQRLHAVSHFIQLFYAATAVTVKQVIDESHVLLPFAARAALQIFTEPRQNRCCRILFLFYYILAKM